jgi:hypothetical protein
LLNVEGTAHLEHQLLLVLLHQPLQPPHWRLQLFILLLLLITCMVLLEVFLQGSLELCRHCCFCCCFLLLGLLLQLPYLLHQLHLLLSQKQQHVLAAAAHKVGCGPGRTQLSQT